MTVNKKFSLKGYKILVTAGGTQEPLDAIRFIGNKSSGIMGFSLAKEAKKRGAYTILISGPTTLPPPRNIKVIPVRTAKEMYQVCLKYFSRVDAVVKAAAVSDFRPEKVAKQKIKRTGRDLTIVLKENPDILKSLGKRKKNHQVLIGFSAETENLIEYARKKLQEKNLDMIVANDISRRKYGIGSKENKVTIITRDGRIEETPILPKEKIAIIIINKLAQLLREKTH